MEPENVIEVNDVRKSFKVYKDRGYMLKEMVLFANRRKYEASARSQQTPSFSTLPALWAPVQEAFRPE